MFTAFFVFIPTKHHMGDSSMVGDDPNPVSQSHLPVLPKLRNFHWQNSRTRTTTEFDAII